MTKVLQDCQALIETANTLLQQLSDLQEQLRRAEEGHQEAIEATKSIRAAFEKYEASK